MLQLVSVTVLIREGRRLRARDIPRVALQAPTMSSFVTIFWCGSELALITMTGLDHRKFLYLLTRFEVVFLRYIPYCADGHIAELTETTRGSPRTLSATTGLGLILTWYRTRGSCFSLCIFFGITSSVCAMFLRFSRRIIMRVLSWDCMSRVCLPTREEVETYQSVFR